MSLAQRSRKSRVMKISSELCFAKEKLVRYTRIHAAHLTLLDATLT